MVGRRLLLLAILLPSAAKRLPPPRLVPGVGAGLTELIVPVTEELALTLLEADESQQGMLVQEALESDLKAGSSIDDPYGVVLWPAAQVVASALCNEDLRNASTLECEYLPVSILCGACNPC